jgi:hypothetical protein
MFKKVFIILIIYFLFGGCSNKLNLLAPYKESVSVYGLLNWKDAINYIRIERVFLGAGNAYTMAQNQDSVYFKSGELRVSLQRWNTYTGIQVSVDSGATATAMEIVLSDTLIQANVGTFNTNERVYKTNHKLYASDTDCVYKLVIHNNKTGKEYTAQTGLIPNFQLIIVSNANNALAPNYNVMYNPLNIVPPGSPGVTCQYNSPVNAGVCSLTMRLFYTEYGNITLSKYVDLGLGTYYPSTIFGGETQKFDYLGPSLLSSIAASIPVNTSVERTADSIKFLLSAGGSDLALYNEVNTSSPLSQSTPNYSNISGGIGVFSSRYQLSLKRLIAKAAIDTIASSSITCNLRFRNEYGALVPCH